MQAHTISTALSKSRIPFFIILVVITGSFLSFGIWGANHVTSLRALLLPDSAKPVLYIPNSYLTYLVRKAVSDKADQLYDKTKYVYYDLSYSSTTLPASKSFNLYLSPIVNKGGKAVPNPAAVIQKEIKINLVAAGLSITSKDLNNSDFTLYTFNYSDLTFTLNDPIAPPYGYSDNTITIFTPNAIMISYLKDMPTLNNFGKALDSKSQFQNVGISVIFPFQFTNLYTKTNRIYFKTSEPSLKTLYVKDFKIVQTGANEISAQISVQKENSPLPAALTGYFKLDASNCTIIGIDSISYDNSSLSNDEINQMELVKGKCTSSINQDYINNKNPIAIQADGDNITFTSLAGLKAALPLHNGSISFTNNALISTINTF